MARTEQIEPLVAVHFSLGGHGPEHVVFVPKNYTPAEVFLHRRLVRSKCLFNGRRIR